MNSSFLYSLLIHLIVGLFLFVSVPSWQHDEIKRESAILWVNLKQVEISDKTNLPQKKEMNVVKQEVVKKQVIKQPPPKSKHMEVVQRKIKQEDAVPVVEQKPKQEEKKKEPKIPVKQKPQAPQPQKEKTKKKESQPPEDDDLNSLFSSVEKMSKSDKMQNAKDKNEMLNVIDGVLDGYANSSNYDPSQKVSVSEIDFIRSVVKKYWRLDAGIEELENMIVELDVTLTPDGSVSSVDVKDTERMQSDGNYRSVAESARRAIYICDKLQSDSPFRQLAQKHQATFRYWRKLHLTFDPKE